MHELHKAFDGVSEKGKMTNEVLKRFSWDFESTGLIPNRATYVDNMSGFDGRPAIAKAIGGVVAKVTAKGEDVSKGVQLDLTKAQSISGLASGTTDMSLIPVYVDPVIVDLTRRLTPLVELIPRVTNYGKTADYNQTVNRGVTGFRLEDAAMDEANDVYARQSSAIKYLYQVGRVTGPMLAASRQYLSNQYIDALNLEVRQKTVTYRYVEEDAILNGDASATRTAYGGSASGGDALNYAAEFSGIYKILNTAFNPTGGGGSITPTTSLSTTALTLSNMRTGIRNARTAAENSTYGQGDPNLAVTDFTTYDNMKGLIQQYLRYVNTNFEVAWGLKTLEFEGLPVIPSKFNPTTTDARKVAILSTDTWQMRVLQDITYEELAKTNDSYKFMLKGYETLVCTAPVFNRAITAITDA